MRFLETATITDAILSADVWYAQPRSFLFKVQTFNRRAGFRQILGLVPDGLIELQNDCTDDNKLVPKNIRKVANRKMQEFQSNIEGMILPYESSRLRMVFPGPNPVQFLYEGIRDDTRRFTREVPYWGDLIGRQLRILKTASVIPGVKIAGKRFHVMREMQSAVGKLGERIAYCGVDQDTQRHLAKSQDRFIRYEVPMLCEAIRAARKEPKMHFVATMETGAFHEFREGGLFEVFSHKGMKIPDNLAIYWSVLEAPLGNGSKQ